MDETVKQTLRQIGSQLDREIYPTVKNGGFVTPSENVVLNSTLGEEINHEKPKSRRPEAGSRQGTTGGQGTSDQASSVICTDFREQYVQEVKDIAEAYPGTQVWYQPEGLVLLVHSAILAGLERPAIFLVLIPYDVKSPVKGWGFWISSIKIEWIGPRHTNFPDGSICAFEPLDRTWTKGNPLVELLDLYTLWALRHLYMAVFGRWPGQQSVQQAYERTLELHDDEYCGCGHSNLNYADCCKPKDHSKDIISNAIRFLMLNQGYIRNPPESVTNFVWEQTNPTNLCLN